MAHENMAFLGTSIEFPPFGDEHHAAEELCAASIHALVSPESCARRRFTNLYN
jgi:hypothetical protein